MDEFILLKRTYPISQYERECDGYKYIIDESTEDERMEWGIKDSQLQEIININEKYVYEVGKIEDKFVTKSCSFKNYKIIRNHILGLEDE